MKYKYGLIFFAWLAMEEILNLNINLIKIACLLGALCLFIIKEKYHDKTSVSIIYLILVIILTQYKSSFILLSGIPLIDFVYSKKIPMALITFALSLFFCILYRNFNYIFYLVSTVFFAYILGVKDEDEKNYISSMDTERRLRYNLELTQNQLIRSKKEIEHLTEIRERNRIAHEIHDNIGHSIVGVIFQLEGALRIIRKDKEKTESILRLCSDKLSEALELTRNTVFNIKSDKKLGIEAIEKIINDFKFCEVIFEHRGDFSLISVSNMQILVSNIMEFLTNASKHSYGTNIKIKVDIGKKNIRLYYKDNGLGCRNIKNNTGLSGIRDRVKDAGGTVAIDGNNGFLIVCNIPV